MKLQEIMESEFLVDHAAIVEWINENNLDNCGFKVVDDGTVNVISGQFRLADKQITKLPVRFGIFPKISSSQGFFSVSNSNIDSFDGFPTELGGLIIGSCPNLTSLIGINENFSELSMINFGYSYIKEGSLGLILIPDLQLLMYNGSARTNKVFSIIKRYLGKPDLIYECQAELVAEELEEYAQL